MIKQNKKLILSIFSFVLFFLLLITQLINSEKNDVNIKQIQRRFSREEAKLNEITYKLDSLIEYNKLFDKDIRIKITNEICKHKDFSFFISKKNKQIYWSDNKLDLVNLDFSDNHNLIDINNNLCFITINSIEDYKIISLIVLRRQFLIENTYLKTTFNENIFPKGTYPVVQKQKKNNIVNDNKEFAFGVKSKKIIKGDSTLILIYFVLCVALIFIILNQVLAKIKNKLYRNIGIIFLIISSFIVFYWLSITELVFIQNLFIEFNHKALIASFPNLKLGELFFSSILLLFSFYCFFKYYSFFTLRKYKTLYKILIYILNLSTILVFYTLVAYIFKELLSTTEFTTQIFNIITITKTSIFILLIYSILSCCFFIIFTKIILHFYVLFNIKIFSIVSILVLAIISYFSGFGWLLFNTIFIYSILFILSKYNKNFGFLLYALIITVLSFYTIRLIHNQHKIQENKISYTAIKKIRQERDLHADSLLVSLNKKIKDDIFIFNETRKEKVDEFKLSSYISQIYLKGYWDNYNAQIAHCRDNDSINIQPENHLSNCFDFFNNLSQGFKKIKNTDFYYIDTFDGITSYLGEIKFYSGNKYKSKVFIKLDSKIKTEGVGFPELLKLNKIETFHLPKKYSYSKYTNGNLLISSGNFIYPLKITHFGKLEKEFTKIKQNGFKHIINKVGKNNYVIVTKPLETRLDFIFLFAYLLTFNFLLLCVLYFIANPNTIKFKLNLKNRILSSMFIILIVSVCIIGGGLVMYNVKSNNDKHVKNVRQQINTVVEEIESEIENYTYLKADLRKFFKGILIKLSNVLHIDINIYNLEGILFESSRSEIFENKIISDKINPKAYAYLTLNFGNEYIEDESIGELKYLAAYIPFRNKNKEIIGFINIPYFSDYSKLKTDSANIIVSASNILLILLLLITFIAIIISRGITKPLYLIQENIRLTSLTGDNKKINYKRHDEIGQLVKEYNVMLDKLKESTNKLSKTEREIAWREMAKQVAHEIKNPLTPMKLSIQYLTKAWNTKSDNFENYFNKVTKSLIEQIDTLSGIATAFSDFAKMPKANEETFELCSIVEKCTDMYKSSEDTSIEFINIENKNTLVHMDKKLLSRAIINLITNAIQAIPSSRKGIIKVMVYNINNNAVIKVEDNGTGIPEHIKNKLFEPNFTTKNSGMGLGLAIVKNIINNAGGDINFELNKEFGTSFYIYLPISNKG